MIAAWFPFPFAERHPTKFAAPDDQSLIQQASTFQVRQQACNRKIDFTRMLTMIGFDALVSIPGFLQMASTGIKLYETNSTLHQSTCDQAIAAEFVGWMATDSVEILSCLGFL